MLSCKVNYRSIPFHCVSSCIIDELNVYVYHNLDLNILLFLWLMPPIFKFQFEKYLNIFLLLVGFGRLLSKWPNFTKTMEWNKTGAPFYNIITFALHLLGLNDTGILK